MIEIDSHDVSEATRSNEIEDYSIIIDEKVLETFLKPTMNEIESTKDEKIILKEEEVQESDTSKKLDLYEHEIVKEELLVQVQADKIEENNEIFKETEMLEMENNSPLKEPVPIPRKMIQTIDEPLEVNIKEKEVIQPSTDTWEPQTIVHNNQILVVTPPPTYPPPTLPNSYLSDDSEESVSTDEYDDKNPPQPPKRYRIYVVNSDSADTTKVKPILKTRAPAKRVSFDNASPDIFVRTPDLPSYVENEIETGNEKSPLMPNLVNEMSPRIRSVAFEAFEDDKEQETKIEKQKEDETIFKFRAEEKQDEGSSKVPCENVSTEENMPNKSKEPLLLEKEDKKIETTKDIEVTSSPKIPEYDGEKKPIDKTLVLDLQMKDFTQTTDAENLQSPLDEKIAYFKLLAEKLNTSPVRSPDRQFAELLSPEPNIIKKGFNEDDLKEKSVEDDQKDSVNQVKPVDRIKITETTNDDIRRKPQTNPQRPTSLLLNNATTSNRAKPLKRQLSEPAVTPRDALLDEIRSFKDKQQLRKRDFVRKSDTNVCVKTPESEQFKVDVEESFI